MGSDFNIIFFDSDSTHAGKIAKNAFKIVDSLNNSFSDYIDNSEISIIGKNAGNGKWISVSHDLLNILQESKIAYIKSNGSFDISLGQMTRLWRFSKKENKVPENQALKNALKKSGLKYLSIDITLNRAKLDKEGVLLDLGGIGKGYAAQKVLNYFITQDIKSVLVNAAGNMAIGDAPLNKISWEIAVEMPNENKNLSNFMLHLINCAVSTSGDAYQFVEIKGKRYSHLINPKTGMGLTNQKQVTIIAENATKADWLSTTCCILPIKKALRLAKKENAAILIIENKNGILTKTSSKMFDNLTLKPNKI